MVIFKVLVLGDGENKTKILHQFVHGKFQKQYLNTNGIEPSSRYETIDGKRITYSIWDIPDLDRFKEIRNMLFRNTDAAIVFFDLTDRSTYEGMDKWIHEVRDECPKAILVITGTNNEIVDARKVTEAEARNKANDYMALKYIETNKSGDNLAIVFRIIGEELLHQRKVL